MLNVEHSFKFAVIRIGILAAIVALGFASAFAVPSRAHAGARLGNAVLIAPVLGTTRWAAQGGMGAARNSLSPLDYIGCTFSVSGAGGQWDAHCNARNGSFTVACNVPPLNFDLFLDPMRAMTQDASVRFEWEPATGLCTKLEVVSASTQEPKLL